MHSSLLLIPMIPIVQFTTENLNSKLRSKYLKIGRGSIFKEGVICTLGTLIKTYIFEGLFLTNHVYLIYQILNFHFSLSLYSNADSFARGSCSSRTKWQSRYWPNKNLFGCTAAPDAAATTVGSSEYLSLSRLSTIDTVKLIQRKEKEVRSLC